MPRYHVSVGDNGAEKARPCKASSVENCPYYHEGAAHGESIREAEENHEYMLMYRAGSSFGSLPNNDYIETDDNMNSNDDTSSGGFDIFASLSKIQNERESESHADMETDDTSMNNDTVNDMSLESPVKKEILGGSYKSYSGKDLYNETDERVYNDKKTGVYKTKNTGFLTEKGAFNETSIHGVIDYTNLQEGDDTRVFGFGEIAPYEPYMLKEYNNEDEKSYTDMSLAEYDQSNDEEHEALEYFTGNDFKWVNDSLYGNKGLSNRNWESDENVETAPLSKVLELTSSGDEEEDDTGIVGSYDDMRTMKSLKRITDAMDSALLKGAGKQRYLYRSMKGSDSFLQENGENLTANDWLSKHDNVLGKEISFNGYQSTSDKTDGVKKFTRDSGVILEILSPEGMSISSKSSFQDEYEVVLPRNQKYMVVGAHKHVDIDFPQTHHTAYRSEADNMTILRLVAINSKGEVLDGTNSDAIKPL